MVIEHIYHIHSTVASERDTFHPENYYTIKAKSFSIHKKILKPFKIQKSRWKT